MKKSESAPSQDIASKQKELTSLRDENIGLEKKLKELNLNAGKQNTEVSNQLKDEQQKRDSLFEKIKTIETSFSTNISDFSEEGTKRLQALLEQAKNALSTFDQEMNDPSLKNQASARNLPVPPSDTNDDDLYASDFGDDEYCHWRSAKIVGQFNHRFWECKAQESCHRQGSGLAEDRVFATQSEPVFVHYRRCKKACCCA